MSNSKIDTMSVNAIRVLAADAVQKANSGHPGLPLGSAAMAYELWAKHMNHNPKNPEWPNRDRFVLSGGHGSTLLYSLLHLFGYGLTVEDLGQFRQMDSLTPGHPEYRHTKGVEATTGPLGAGMGMAVGMALAEAHLAAVFNKEGFPVVDHYTYVLGGDGCMMEGISSEAFSLAGTLGLSKLVVLYDSNQISIEGSTDIAFTENVQKRMEAFGFQTITVEDGNDLEAIGKAIEEAKADTKRPSFITVKTQIGYGCPAKQGKASAHGEPLGADNVTAMKENLEWPSQEPFYVPEEVYQNYQKLAESKGEAEEKWNVLFASYCEKYPEQKELWDQYYNEDAGQKIYDCEEYWAYEEKADATRSLSGKQIQKIKGLLPNLIGGAADLSPSTKTYMNGMGDFSKENVADPEQKRKIIGGEFIRVFEEEARKLEGIDFLGQGTIYPDIIESGTKTAKMVKSHHNVGGLPEDLKFELVEPLKQLFKDEVRACGVELGLPHDMVYRQPFPGPGLGVRCLGAITRDRLEAVRESDAILREEFAKAGLDKKVWQYFTVVPDFKSVGMKNNARVFEYMVIIRAINTIDAMTASIEKVDWDVLEKITGRILEEVGNVNRVCYDMSPKPPATIEFE